MTTTLTPKLSLVKPTLGTHELASISVINGNMDILDNAVTLTATQTLTGKTLTSPHMTGAVVDSGGLTVTAGGLTVTAGNLAINSAIVSTAALFSKGTTSDSTAYALWTQKANATNLLLVRNDGLVTLPPPPAFVASDKYLVISAAGDVHVSALGPAS